MKSYLTPFAMRAIAGAVAVSVIQIANASEIRRVADSSSGDLGSFAINESGHVLYASSSALMLDLGDIADTTLAQAGSDGLARIDFRGALALSNSGLVAFEGRESNVDPRTSQLFMLDQNGRGELRQVTSSSSPFSSTTRDFVSVSIDDAGAVRAIDSARASFSGSTTTSYALNKIETGNTTFIRSFSDNFSFFSGGSSSRTSGMADASFTHDGEIVNVFRDASSSFSGTRETTRLEIQTDDETIVVADGSNTNSSAAYRSLTSGDMNSAGTIIFAATEQSGIRSLNVADAQGSFSTLVDNTGEFSSFSNVAIDRAGNYAVLAFLDNGTKGIFADSSEGIGSVVLVGDELFGSVITDLSFRAHHLSERGHLAFSYTLDNGITGIATVQIPASSTLPLLALGGLISTRRRRS